MSVFAMLLPSHSLRLYFEEKRASGQHWNTSESCQAHIDNLTEAHDRALAEGITAKAAHQQALADWLSAMRRSGLAPDAAEIAAALVDCKSGVPRQALLKRIRETLNACTYSFHTRKVAKDLLTELSNADLHWRAKRASLRIDVRLRQAEIEAWQEYQQIVSEGEASDG